MKTGYVGLGARIANVSNCLQEVCAELDPCAYVDPTPAGLKYVEEKKRQPPDGPFRSCRNAEGGKSSIFS
ncbi:hypothetical protein QW131_08215 [Roseibium salinum]|nr:hypothetical protein [Roseibium salinum]